MSDEGNARRTYSSAASERARNLRTASSPAEKLLWARLKGHKVEGLKFHRQYPIGRYYVQFYCAELHLAVEVIGSGTGEADVAGERAERLERYRARVIHVQEIDVQTDLADVVSRIAKFARELQT